MANITGYNRKLAAVLRRNALIDDQVLGVLSEKAAKDGVLLANILITEKHIDEPTLLGLVSEDCGVPPLDLEKLTVSLDDLKELNGGVEPLSEDVCKANQVLPLAIIGGFMSVAVANPYDVVLLDNLKIQLGRQLLPVLSTERAVVKAIELCFHAAEKAVEQVMESMEGDDLTLSDMEKTDDDQAKENKADAEADLNSMGDDSPAVKAVKHILSMAIKTGASDIHIEPYEKKTRVRLRIDGVLHEKLDLPKKLERSLCSRIKIMTDTMNIAERGKPQDGRISVK
ncbi:MAG: hypothetical protein RLZZ127_3034, partial [Planctomycetota bacterium]